MLEESLSLNEKVGLLLSENAEKILLPLLEDKDLLKLKLCKLDLQGGFCSVLICSNR